jgi:hypothetical protein
MGIFDINDIQKIISEDKTLQETAKAQAEQKEQQKAELHSFVVQCLREFPETAMKVGLKPNRTFIGGKKHFRKPCTVEAWKLFRTHGSGSYAGNEYCLRTDGVFFLSNYAPEISIVPADGVASVITRNFYHSGVEYDISRVREFFTNILTGKPGWLLND